LHETGQHGGFRNRQLPRRFSEIALRRGFDAVGARAEIDAIKIELENLRLGEFVFEPQRKHHFLQFARDRALLGQEQILGELLGDGRSALGGAAAQNVADGGAQDAPWIDTVMGVEAAVLDGDERVRHVDRQVAHRHGGTAHVPARGERCAVEAENESRWRAFRNFQRLDRRQMDADPNNRADAGDHEPKREDRTPVDKAAEAGAAFLAAATALAGLPGAFIVAAAG
jgi:hypothetical protein